MRKLIDNKTAEKLDKLNEYPFEKWYITTPSPTVYVGQYITNSSYKLVQTAPNEPYTTYTQTLELNPSANISTFFIRVIAGDDMDGDYELTWSFELTKPITNSIHVEYLVKEAKSTYMTGYAGELQELKTGYGKYRDADTGITYRVASAGIKLPYELQAFALSIKKINGIIYIGVTEI